MPRARGRGILSVLVADAPKDPKAVFDSFQDVFADLFASTRPRGPDLSLALSVPLIEVAHGATRRIEPQRSERCARCGGTGGAVGGTLTTCGGCGGAGKRDRREGLLALHGTCSDCGGRGKRWDHPCDDCGGSGVRHVASKPLEVTIPPGTPSGARLRLKGQGNENGDTRGDLYVTIDVAPHPTLVRDGDHLRARVRFDAERAVRGGVLVVPWLEGHARVPMPAGSKVGDELRVPGWGCVRLGSAYAAPPDGSGAPYRTAAAARGDLIVTLVDAHALSNAYRTLGVHVGASRNEIDAAYRRLAIHLHPERNPEKPDAAAAFAKLNAAYAEIRRTTVAEGDAPAPRIEPARWIALGLGVVFAITYFLLR